MNSLNRELFQSYLTYIIVLLMILNINIMFRLENVFMNSWTKAETLASS